MKFPCWLSNFRRPPQGRAARRPSRLFLEPLEDRCVPSTIQGTVLNLGTNSGLGGWTVWLDLNKDRLLDPGDPVTTTAADGNYSFDTTNVPAAYTDSSGSYDIVQLDLQVGTGGRWLNRYTYPTDALVNRTTTPNATQVNFGLDFFPTAGIAPAGSESPVNVTATGAPQGYPAGTNVSVSADAIGNCVVAWQKYVTGSPGTIYARVFDADGSARTGEIAVGAGTVLNSTSPNLLEPMVAMAGNGQFLVAWTGPQGINAQAFDAHNAAVGSTATVLAFNATTTGELSGVAADATGDFVALYNVETKKGSNWSSPTVYAQRYTSLGAATGSAIKVAAPNLINGHQSVAMAGAGNFVVAWDDIPPHYSGVSGYVYAQQYTASGRTAGSRITVVDGARYPSVAMNASGQFVVISETWVFVPVMGGRSVSSAVVYNPDGTMVGNADTVAVDDGIYGQPISVAMDGAGNVTCAWTYYSANVYEQGQVRMRFLPAGGTQQPRTLANTTTQGARELPGVAATGNGSFVVVWEGYGAADPAGIYSQRFAPLSSPLAAGGVAPGGEAAAAAWGNGTRRLAVQTVPASSSVPSFESFAALFGSDPLPSSVAPVHALVQATSRATGLAPALAGSSQLDTAKTGAHSVAAPIASPAILDRVFGEQTWSADPFAKELLTPLW
jgi:hypothetical protein